jgi:hypothetical protein
MQRLNRPPRYQVSARLAVAEISWPLFPTQGVQTFQAADTNISLQHTAFGNCLPDIFALLKPGNGESLFLGPGCIVYISLGGLRREIPKYMHGVGLISLVVRLNVCVNLNA